MGHRVNPIANRLGINRSWSSAWYADFHHQQYARFLTQDLMIRKYLKQQLRFQGVTEILIERIENYGRPLRILIKTAFPGLIIGPGGQRINKLRRELNRLMRNYKLICQIDVQPERNPYRKANFVAEKIAQDLENRAPFRRAQKIVISKALDANVLGIRTAVTGRLGGVDIARREEYLRGKMPLATFRYDIDYALAEAYTTYGVIGVKVWIAREPIFRKGGVQHQLAPQKRRERFY